MEKLVKICDQKLKLAANYQIGLNNFCPNCTKQRDIQGVSWIYSLDTSDKGCEFLKYLVTGSESSSWTSVY